MGNQAARRATLLCKKQTGRDVIGCMINGLAGCRA